LQNACERGNVNEVDQVQPVVTAAEIMEFQELVHHVLVDPQLLRYIATIVEKTRNHSSLYLGGSPRASLSILRASRAFAALEGRDFVTPEDIQEVLFPVLTHRVILSPEKEMEGVRPEAVIRQIVDSVDVPR
jgi:MoxR-like ATPase